jgi:hypothetical protein
MTVTINGTTGVSGNGSGLTNLNAANISGTLPSLNAANLTSLSAPALTGNIDAARIASTSLNAANLTGTLPAISGANLTGLPGGGQIEANLNGTNAVTLTGIPSGVRRVQVLLYNHSYISSSVSSFMRFGTSGGIKTAGYVSYSKTFLEAAHTNQTRDTAFNWKSLAAAEVMSGIGNFALRSEGSHIWVGSWQFSSGQGTAANMSGNNMSWGNGHVDLGSALTQIQIRSESNYTHDAGARATVNWSY